MRFAWLILALAPAASAQMRVVQVDAAKVTGAIRSLQGVNNGPLGIVPQAPDVSKQYKDLRIDIIRTHDFFGPVDIDAKWLEPRDPIAVAVHADSAKCVFPNWEADPEKEASYNFGPTDKVINAIVGVGAAPYYRIGRSWAADGTPPADFDKYANIVKHVAMHYNSGWAQGYKSRVRYWEFWNEPNVTAGVGPGGGMIKPFWAGTPQQYYDLYEKVAHALKSYDPAMKVGGSAVAGGFPLKAYREDFIAYCAAHKVPLDFFSWHDYAMRSGDPWEYVRVSEEVRALLDKSGFTATESHLTEWNLSASTTPGGPPGLASMQNAAFSGAVQIYLQDTKVDRSMFYRGDAGAYGMFDPDGSYHQAAYVYRALGAMLDTPRRLAATGADSRGFAVLAGRSADGKKVQILISNCEIKPYRGKGPEYENNAGYALTVSHLPWGKGEFTVKRYRVTTSEKWAESESSGKGGTLEISNPLPPPGVELIVIGPK